jgi:hypothetical protein
MQDVEISTQMFRDGMARLGSSVNVITSDGPSGRLRFYGNVRMQPQRQPPVADRLHEPQQHAERAIQGKRRAVR